MVLQIFHIPFSFVELLRRKLIIQFFKDHRLDATTAMITFEVIKPAGRFKSQNSSIAGIYHRPLPTCLNAENAKEGALS